MTKLKGASTKETILVKRKNVPMISKEEQVESFPRGGAPILTHLERKQLFNQASLDITRELAETPNTDNHRSKVKSRKIQKKADMCESDEKDGDHTSATVKASLPFIERLKFKTLNVNMEMIGMIKNINATDISVALPYHLTGYVRVSEMSDELFNLLNARANVIETANVLSDSINSTELDTISETVLPDWKSWLSIGMPVRVKVIHLDTGSNHSNNVDRTKRFNLEESFTKHNRIELSLRPSILNSCLTPELITLGFELTADVQSIEDHGYILNLGLPQTPTINSIQKMSAFLPFEKAHPENPNYAVFQKGQLIPNVVVQSVSNHVLTVKISDEVLKFSERSTAVVSKEWTYDSIYPSLLLRSKIVKIIEGKGLILELHEKGLYGTIDIFHVNLTSGKSLVDHFQIGDELLSRVLMVDRENKAISLTCLTHLVEWSGKLPTFSSLKEGQLVNDWIIERVDPSYGILMYQTEYCIKRAYCHITRLKDSLINGIDENDYPIGSKHVGRVIDKDVCEEVVHVSLQPSITASSYISIESIAVGSIVKGKVVRIEDYGVLVQLSERLRALCPAAHWTDGSRFGKATSCPFHLNQSSKFRVLSVHLDEKKILLTKKPSLVHSIYPPLVSLPQIQSDLANGVVPESPINGTHGFVIKIKENAGAVIAFYNDVKGFLPMKEVSYDPISNINEILQLGQVVLVKPIHANVEKSSLILSMKLVAQVRKENTDLVTVKKANELAKKSPKESLDLLGITIGSVTKAKILSCKGSQINCCLAQCPSIQGRISFSKINFNQLIVDNVQPKLLSEYDSLDKNEEVIVKVESFRNAKNFKFLPLSHVDKQRLMLEFVPCNLENESVKPLTDQISIEGSGMVGLIRKVIPGVGILISGQLSDNSKEFIGRVHIQDFEFVPGAKDTTDEEVITRQDSLVCDPLSAYRPNQIVSYRIKQSLNGKYDLSMEIPISQSVFDRYCDLLTVSRNVTDLSQLEIGQKISGYITNVSSNGVFFCVSSSVTARIKISNLSPKFDKDWLNHWENKLGHLVCGWIVSLKVNEKKLEVSLKGPWISKENREQMMHESSPEVDTKMSQLFYSPDEADENIEKGDELKLKRRDETKLDNLPVKKRPRQDYPESNPLSLLQKIQMNDCIPCLSSLPDDTEMDKSETNPKGDATSFSSPKDNSLSTSVKDSDSLRDNLQRVIEVPAKRSKKLSKLEEEKLIADVEVNLAQDNRVPTSTSDFEKLLLASPHSSFVWVQFIAYTVSLGKIDAARSVAKRALASIPYRDEEEKFNIWGAWLSLEWNVVMGTLYRTGSDKGKTDKLDWLIREASARANPKKIYLLVWDMCQATLLDSSSDTDSIGVSLESKKIAEKKLKELELILCQKFKSYCKVWIRIWSLYAKLDKRDVVGSVYHRALQSLPSRKHIEFNSKLAHIEYSLVSGREHGRTLFESLLSAHPKRFDLWLQYIHMEIKSDSPVEQTRRLFDRCISMPFSSKKMRTLFKAYLEFEKKLESNSKGIQRVKRLAQEYVQRVIGSNQLEKEDDNEVPEMLMENEEDHDSDNSS